MAAICQKKRRRLISNLPANPIAITLAAAALGTLVMSCGLEYVLALNPPEYVETSVTDKFYRIMLTNDNSETEFRGVEFYYKFYGKDDTNLATNLSTFDELVSGGFYRMPSSSDETTSITKPLLSIPIANRGYKTQVTLSFADIANVNLDADEQETNGYTVANIALRRGIDDGTGSYKRFSAFASTDADISYIGQNFATDPEAKLLMYALSYGKKDITTDAHSKAICLFNININITIVP